MPGQVKTIRTLMFVAAGWAAVIALAIFVAEGGITAVAIGGALFVLIPGTACALLAWRIPRGGRRLRIGIIAMEIVYALLALGTLGQGDPRGFPQLIIPGVVLFLITRPQAVAHFRGD